MNKIIFRLVSLFLFGILPLLFVLPASANDIVIIANKEVDVNALDKKDIKSVFLGNKKTWDNNLVIVPVLSKKEIIHKKFLKQYVKRSSRQFKNVWKKNLFLGKASMPKSFADEKQLIKFISETSGAIGYITSGFQTDEIKIITVN